MRLKDAEKYKKFVNEFEMVIKNKRCSDLIFLCVGTDKVIGDTFGPIVGSLLISKQKNHFIPNMEVIGCLEKNIGFNQIHQQVEKVKLNYENPIIISIDSALGKKDNIGKIFVNDDGIIFGKSLDKKNNKVGDLGIRAVVGENKNNIEKNFGILQNISLNSVLKLSNIVSKGIFDVMYKKTKLGKNIYI